MRIKKLNIKNFKSLVDFELENLKPFCVFVGPNASGKSNIFEALEFTNYFVKYTVEAPSFFGGVKNIYSYYPTRVEETNFQSDLSEALVFNYSFEDGIQLDAVAQIIQQEEHQSTFPAMSGTLKPEQLNFYNIRDLQKRKQFINQWKNRGNPYHFDFEQFIDNFSRIFVGKPQINKGPQINSKLSPDASNLSQIIGGIFEDQEARQDFIEWLRILIPEFRDIEVKKSNIDGTYDFFIFEKTSQKPFPRHLVSDGTMNILSLMAAVYQVKQPQFLCIEEPENGLHPQAIELLVDFFREKCEDGGHHIWLATHSQTLVRCLEIEEVVLVNKLNGITKAKQLTQEDNIDIKTDEAWLSNALGGGVL